MNATKNVSLNPREAGGGAAAEIASAKRPAPAPTPLKAERVQLSAASTRARLKAERVQEKLRGLPGWRLAPGGQAIDRRREFRDPPSAAAYVTFLAQLAARTRQPVVVQIVGNRVGVTLWARSEQGRPAELNAEVLHFARAIG